MGLAPTAIVALGALVQGCVGFGLALVAAPLLMLLDPRLVPGPLLLAALVLAVLMSWRERKEVVLSELTWAVAGRFAGSAIAATLIVSLPANGLALLFGILVLTGVAISATGYSVRPTTATVLAASTLSGLMGTITSAGGPPMALLYQRSAGPQLRAMLSSYFLAGTIISIAMLWAAGRFGLWELKAGLALTPGAVLGFLGSGPLASRADRRAVRPLVLAVAGVSAVAVIVRAIT